MLILLENITSILFKHIKKISLKKNQVDKSLTIFQRVLELIHTKGREISYDITAATQGNQS